MSSDSVGTAPRMRSAIPRKLEQILGRTRRSLSLHSVQTGSGTHTTPYVMHTTGSFTVVRWLRCKLTTHHHLKPRVNMLVTIGLAPMHLKVSLRTGKAVPLNFHSYAQFAQTNYGRTSYLQTRKLFFTLHVETIKKLSTKTVYVKLVYSCRNTATFDKRTHLNDI